MSTMDRQPAKIKILAFGLEKAGFAIPQNPFSIGTGIEIDFQPFDTRSSFSDYDGVIMFQGIWARWKETRNPYGLSDDAYLVDKQDDEMSKRIKELHLLLKKGGFVCFLMDRMGYEDFDLAKTVLGWFPQTYHEETNNAHTLKPKYGELIKYFEKYGVGKTKFSHYGGTDYRVLANAGSYQSDFAVCFERQFFYIPYHCPNKTSQDAENLLSLLLPGLFSVYKKLNQEVPKWVDQYVFEQENKLLSSKEDLVKQIDDIEQEMEKFKDIKKILCYSGELLKESVSKIFSDYFGFTVQDLEEWKEDFSLVSKNDKVENKIDAVVETKGINENAIREHINQVDSHRERNNLPSTIPGILIVNTFMKYNSLDEKDKPIHSDQIKHAVNMNVLVLRTFDIVRALSVIFNKPDKLKELRQSLLNGSGWLEVKKDNFILHKT